MESLHKPVMLKEVMEMLAPRPGDVVLDCTVGVGGHAHQILRRILPGGYFIGIDRDKHSLGICRENLSRYEGHFSLFQGDYRFFEKYLQDLNIEKVDKVLFDLGISSLQLDDPQRGFSFRQEGPLDMRMDTDSFICAFDLVNNLTEEELFRILRNFGQERFAKRIAKKIVKERSRSPIYTTSQLRDIIVRAVPAQFRYQRIDPSTRTFMALRIAVNRELESLQETLNKIFYFMKEEGRCAVISFHSLEDRIVKHTFRDYARKGKIKLLAKKPLVPQAEELKDNSRSRSAKLRAAEVI